MPIYQYPSPIFPTEGPKRESWAIQLGVKQDRIDYWDKYGLQIIDSDLEDFVLALHASLLKT